MISENCCDFIVLYYKALQCNNRYDHRRQNYGIVLYGRWFLPVFWRHDGEIYVEISQEAALPPRLNPLQGRSQLIMILFHDSGYRCLKHFPGDVDDRKPLEYEKFIGLIYGKLIADKGYIGRNLFQRLFVDGIQLITKLKSNMRGALMSISDTDALIISSWVCWGLSPHIVISPKSRVSICNARWTHSPLYSECAELELK